MSKLIVTENPNNWKFKIEGVQVITPADYFGETQLLKAKNTKILNFCRSYQYQSLGYYVSLLAEARGHKVMPRISAIQDFRFPSLIREDSLDFDELIQDTFKQVNEKTVEMRIYMGKTQNEAFLKLASLLFNLLQTPLLKARFVKKEKKWLLQYIQPANNSDIPDEDKPILHASLQAYFEGKKTFGSNISRKKYDLAILVSQEEKTPPSNVKAIQKFVKAADKTGFSVDLITKNDLSKLIQYDALFIRETTNVNHHTFRFAKKAEAEGLIVIDDSDSILKCTNKVYLNEVLQANQILTPKSMMVRKETPLSALYDFGFPLVLKQPDSCFSKGVIKINSEPELVPAMQSLFQNSELLIAQEFMPTAFDWRIGIINNEPLYICKYFMARNHWQIVNWSKAKDKDGKAETLTLSEAPKALIDTAVKATRLIGDSLYGVDIKEVNGQYFVIEVNDNPSIDSGIEDKMIKDQLYLSIMDTLLQRVKSN
ncbi:glutathione synthase/RimK-type ligase-like ATP-grasp enzyme [Catalinimonas alkaloidigena]|uniref:RimK family protein n=1 Tax=Catalinimonas alkaloidigena TaxID=1075417 RepID=UPI0024059B7D|nr:RimK family protein [Catalinimonas alkaloidigena]MDF9797175.1 glutathione synthase/RimK-type ligase-like ATP-grasp enzyme [Catalinimonas alkaloidigena]